MTNFEKNVVLLIGGQSIRGVVKLHEFDDGPVDICLDIFYNSSKQPVWLGYVFSDAGEEVPEFFTNSQKKLDVENLFWGEASLKEMIHHAIIDQTEDYEHPYLEVF